MVGPTGPRRLRLAIEHLANFRGSPCYFIDLDPRWVKKVLAAKQVDVARAYMDHVVEQAVTLLKNRKYQRPVHDAETARGPGRQGEPVRAGIRGVFCGGTTMAPQYVRYIIEEVLEGRIGFYPPMATPSWAWLPAFRSLPRTSSPSPITRRNRAPCCVWWIRSKPPARRLPRLGPRGTDHA
jgi:hypothetical protein